MIVELLTDDQSSVVMGLLGAVQVAGWTSSLHRMVDNYGFGLDFMLTYSCSRRPTILQSPVNGLRLGKSPRAPFA